jgi:EpsI family protein
MAFDKKDIDRKNFDQHACSQKASDRFTPDGEGSGPQAAAGERSPRKAVGSGASLRRRFWVAIGILAVAILCRYTLYRGSGLPPERIDLSGIPPQVGPWQGMDQSLDQVVIDVLGLDAYIQRKYVDPRGRPLWLYIGYYLRQQQGKGIHSPKHCYPGAGWSIVSKGVESIQVGGGHNRMIRVNRILFQKDDRKQIVLYWFQSSDRVVHSEYAQRVYMVLDAIISNRTDGALIKIMAPVAGDQAGVIDYQKEFIKRIYPYLQKEFSGQSRS